MSLEDYRAGLASGSTTRARCWRVTRRDGVVLGATDHDRDLAFDGTAFEAAAGYRGSEIASGLGLAVGEGEAEGALSSGAITEADIIRGRFDGALVEVFDVDWTDPEARKLLGVFEIGEVERTENAFRAEIRSVFARLGQKEGRSFVPICDAELGDARCGVDLDSPAWKGAGTVDAAAAGGGFLASGLSAFEPGHFNRGLVTWTSGANAGRRSEVRAGPVAHAGGAGALVYLWRLPADPIAAGDGFTITAGCDKSFAMCRDRFANAVNFRGFPKMPGENAPVEYAVRGDSSQDGGPR